MPRRVPTAVLRPPLDLCKPTGVTLDADSRVVVALDQGGVGKSLSNRLQKLGVTVLAIEEPPASDALIAQLETWLAGGPIQGVYWLTALDEEPALAEMTLDDWREANRLRVKNLSQTMRVLYDAVSGANNFLVAATRLGGLHGYGDDGATAPLGGAVTGFTKAYKRERPDVLVKAVDFAPTRKTAVPADVLIAETLTDPGVVEVGYPGEAGGDRFTISLREQAAHSDTGVSLDGDTVFVVTGAAGGITSAIVADLAAASGGVFYLLDLIAAPARDDQNVALFRSDQDALKQQLINEAKAAGEKPTPVMIDKQMLAIERQEAALRAIETVEAAGGTAVYHSVNLLDGPAIAAVVEEIREKHGRIDVLIHAGGIEISKALNQKPAEQFDLVFDIKADGFFSLLKAAGEMPIGATVVFSSVAGRFGNSGQTDYSAANDLLCKLSSSLRRWRPGTRAIAIDWTAWGGIGMATRGSIPRIMEMAGIDMLPPQAGIPTVRRELLGGGGEVVVAGALGVMVEEFDETGGVDPEKLLQRYEGTKETKFLMVENVKAYKLYGGLEVETTLDPQAQPFLYDHAMEGTPLLPGVMGTEAFAGLAALAAPGYVVAAVENEDFHAPFKFYRMEPQTLYLSATAVPQGDDLLVHTALRSVRELATGTQQKLHFTATVRMTKETPQAAAVSFTPPAGFEVAPEAIYDVYFHGPAYRVLAGVSVNGETAVGLLAHDLPPNANPADAAELMAPRLIELCFQTAGVWEIRTKGQMALPLALDAVTAYRQEAEASGPLYAVVTAVGHGASFNAQVVDADGRVFVDLQGYRTVQLPGTVEL